MSVDYSVIDILNNFNKTITWLQNIKINLNKSRIFEIKRYLEYFIEGYDKFKKGEFDNFPDTVNESGTALNEAVSLNLIREAFSSLNQNHLPIKQLKKAISGTYHSVDESGLDSSNHARNILFELETASYLKLHRGLNLTNEFNDVNFDVLNCKVSIQCKRLLTFSNLEDQFKKAVSQLIETNKIIDNHNSFGLIAFSLEKLYGLDIGIKLVKNKNELNKIMEKTVKDFIDKIVPYWNETIKKYPLIKIVGLQLLYKRAVIYTSKNQLSYKRKFIYHFPKYPKTSIFFMISQAIAGKKYA